MTDPAPSPARHLRELPYDGESPAVESPAVFRCTERDGVVEVTGPCPRCAGRSRTVPEPLPPGTGTKGLRDLLLPRRENSAAALTDERLLARDYECACGHPHEGSGGTLGPVGCGAIWYISHLVRE
ncbi:hypothetical protein [Streptomyces sp. NPDC047046]|uniref:hypothetical protein n=1 Tax=Streptomyces sp. NPDC047046 TaxID=3155378 RepID=UPI0033CA4786